MTLHRLRLGFFFFFIYFYFIRNKVYSNALGAQKNCGNQSFNQENMNERIKINNRQLEKNVANFYGVTPLSYFKYRANEFIFF